MTTKKILYEEMYKDSFSFGKNWNNYLKKLNNHKIKLAEKSLRSFFKIDSFKGKVFLDFGCGSGLFSLAAINLGAKHVISVDIDDHSLACAHYLRNKYKISDKIWSIQKGSALDKEFISSLPKADIVYSWGVLHHTGDMWKALSQITIPLKKDAQLCVAIYNKFKGLPFSSKQWNTIKRIYGKLPSFFRHIADFMWASTIIVGVLAHGKNPITYIKNYGADSCRGMSFMRDVTDWLGGYPYEYASTKEIVSFYKKKDMKLTNMKTTPREGCNEFLFVYSR